MEVKNQGQLILGSQSPRRKELLQWTFLPFDIVVSNLDEISLEEKVESFVQDLARQKAQHVYHKIKNDYTNPYIIGADTIVVIDNEILGKPQNQHDAKEMLLKLKGRSHRVLTGVSIKWADGEEFFYDETKVFFDEFSDELLELYLKTNESLDKAGAYGIQGAALSFIKKIEGSYSNVVGLPVNLVLQKLQSIAKNFHKDNWRKYFEI